MFATIDHSAGTAPPAAIFYFSRDRRGEHPSRHLARYCGILQADAYAGFGELYREARKPVALTEALCWAHGRRNFFKLAQLAKAPLAIEAVRRIDAIFDLERTINGLPQEQRRATRQDKVAPLVTGKLDARCTSQAIAPRRGCEAIDYMLSFWASFSRCLDDGRICLTNNAAERALHGITMAGSLRIPSLSNWNIGSVFAPATRHGRPFRATAALIGGEARSPARIC
jgi:transposase